MKKFLLSVIVLAATTFQGNAQCHFIPATSTATDTLTYTFNGGAFASYGCTPIDPTYWMSGNGMSVTVTFVNPESSPSFRVWGMNDDDTATVLVNGVSYPLTSSSASYTPKDTCGLSPGPDGVLFSGGKLVGANSNAQGNYSYQDVQLNTNNVNSITITGISGAGWGFAGVSVDCEQTSGLNSHTGFVNQIEVFPNPTNGHLFFSILSNVRVISLTGQIMADLKNVNTLDLSDFTAGVYFIMFTDNNGLVLQRSKIVKE